MARAAQYMTWVCVELMPKGVVCSLLSFLAGWLMQCSPSVAEGRQAGQDVAYLEDRHCITKGLVVQKPACFGKGHFTGQGRMLRSCQGFYAPVKAWYRPGPLYDWRNEPRCCQDVTAISQCFLHITFTKEIMHLRKANYAFKGCINQLQLSLQQGSFAHQLTA